MSARLAKKELMQRSKHLSYVLRHAPASAGIDLDPAGWADVGKLLEGLGWSRADLDQIVAENSKKRFEYGNDGARIRASQGHSVDVDLGYDERDPPDHLFHGTSRRLVEAILREGLRRMDRHHVHLSADVPTALVVARRRPEPVVLQVEARAMVAGGHRFFLSTNGVWLTDEVPPLFLRVLEPGM